GVNSGTDALKIPLKALGLGPGDEVITCANTFWATVGAINEVGARSVFVDADDSFGIDIDQIESAITENTKAIMPVHLTGNVLEMDRIMAIADKHGLPVVEDACQSLMGERDGARAGTFGVAAGFSMHPLKIINVWGDAGIIVTNDDEMDRKCRLLRNHGLKNRDEMVMLGYNSRLDSLQAVIGKWAVSRIDEIVAGRIRSAEYFDLGFASIPGVRVPDRHPAVKNVFLLYILFVEHRDELVQYCIDNGIEAKVHYPIPVYQQEALADMGHKPGDFPVTDQQARDTISFPVDGYLSEAEMDHVIDTVRRFYEERKA
ncbi:MAG: DegT/DnrJ/EryC1/StrS family aminotransferase, partial [Pseudomonadota bacterium]